MRACPFCAEEIQDSAIKCKHCGSVLSAVPGVGPVSVVAPSTEEQAAVSVAPQNYAETPWFRRNWFVILTWILITPMSVIILLSGPVYYERNGELKMYGQTARIVLGVLGVVGFVWNVWRFSK